MVVRPEGKIEGATVREIWEDVGWLDVVASGRR